MEGEKSCIFNIHGRRLMLSLGSHWTTRTLKTSRDSPDCLNIIGNRSALVKVVPLIQKTRLCRTFVTFFFSIFGVSWKQSDHSDGSEHPGEGLAMTLRLLLRLFHWESFMTNETNKYAEQGDVAASYTVPSSTYCGLCLLSALLMYVCTYKPRHRQPLDPSGPQNSFILTIEATKNRVRAPS